MKKLILLLFISATVSAQDLTNKQTIGQPSRNQAVGNGFQVADTTLLKGLLWMPNLSTLGGATDSILSIDPSTNMIELRPQSAGGGTDTTAWHITGNAGTVAGTNFIGTTDSIDWVIKTDNTERARVTAAGETQIKNRDSLISSIPFTVMDNRDTTLFRIHGSGQIEAGSHEGLLQSYGNLFIGYNSGLLLGDSVIGNTALGVDALKNITEGHRNTAVGYESLYTQKGHGNGAGGAADSAYENVGIGYRTGYLNTAGYENTWIGTYAGASNTTGHGITALGLSAATANTTGIWHTALGVNTLLSQQGGKGMTAVGSDASRFSVSSEYSTLVGFEAGYAVTGNRNVIMGYDAVYFGSSADENTVIGGAAGFGITTGDNNIILGNKAAFYGNFSNKLFIGNNDFGNATLQDNRTLMRADMNADTSLQQLWVNGTVSILQLTDQRKTINTTASDTATVNAFSGRFRKDTSGTTFTLTNALITANSIIVLTQADAALDATATRWTVSAAGGSATITFDAAPTSDLNMNFIVVN